MAYVLHYGDCALRQLGQTKWAAWVRKQKLTDRLPTDFATLLAAVGTFADPALQRLTDARVWNPATRSWND